MSLSRFKKSEDGFTLLSLIVGSLLVTAVAIVVSRWHAISKTHEIRVVQKMDSIVSRSLLDWQLKASLASAIRGPIYISNTLLQRVGVAWADSITALPIGSVFAKEAAQFNSTGTGILALSGTSPYAGMANDQIPFHVISVLREDGTPSLTLSCGDKIIDPLDSGDGRIVSVRVSGDVNPGRPYAAGDIIAMTTAIGTQLVELVEIDSSNLPVECPLPLLKFRNVTDGTNLWATYLAEGTPLYRVEAHVMGLRQEENQSSIEIRSFRPGIMGAVVKAIPVTASQFTTESLAASTNLDDNSNWVRYRGGFFEPLSKNLMLRIFYTDSHSFKANLLVGL